MSLLREIERTKINLKYHDWGCGGLTGQNCACGSESGFNPDSIVNVNPTIKLKPDDNKQLKDDQTKSILEDTTTEYSW